MNYQQTIQFLYDLLPVFHRIGAKAFKADLSNTLTLCEKLGNPQHKFKSIHIAGTNGKGSSSHYLAAILQSAGYKTGLYTSPHLKDYTERFRINGRPILKSEVIKFVKNHKNLIKELKPSFFELSVALAFDFFAKEKVDIAVIEVGLGGRLDSTNIITPELSLITNIGFDHMDILGDTLAKIAFEKAGIIKPNVPIIVSERHPETENVFLDKAKKENSDISFAEDIFSLRPKQLKTFGLNFDIFDLEGRPVFQNLESQLIGQYQYKNIIGVLASVFHLKKLNYSISDDAIREGFSKVCSLTGLKGRFQILRKNPLIICDTGHNEHGIKEVLKHLDLIQKNEIFFILGFVKDKEISKILQLFPKNGKFYFCMADSPRSETPENLIKIAQQVCIEGYSILNVNEAIKKVSSLAKKDDLIFIGGSNFVVAEIKEL